MKHRQLDRWIDRTLTAIPIRANSLIVTVFGDAIAPHGGKVWLGSLIDLLAPLNISARGIRTSVFRLTQENWLQPLPIGRRSAYSLTTAGMRRIQNAYRRIYETPQTPWHGEWQLVVIPESTLPQKQRDDLRRDLRWEGYGAIAPSVFAHPGGNRDELRSILRQTESEDKVALLTASSLDNIVGTPLRAIVRQCWHLDQLAEDYRRFDDCFRPTLKWLASAADAVPQQCFILRTLLIHEFRRIQLRDPQLPESLLADDWPGHTVRRLCRDIYKQTLPASEQHLLTTVKTPDGDLPAADDSLRRRFAGEETKT